MKHNFLVKSILLAYNRARERPGYQAAGIALFPPGKGANAGG